MRLLSEAENGKRELARGPGSAAERATRNFGSRGVAVSIIIEPPEHPEHLAQSSVV